MRKERNKNRKKGSEQVDGWRINEMERVTRKYGGR